MKVLFLDIDGVLNCTGSILMHRGTENWLSYVKSNDNKGVMACPNPVSCFLLNQLINEGVKIVLSSTWRKSRTVQECEMILQNYFSINQKDFVFDLTPSISGPRGLEIQHWLNSNDRVSHYCILDDNSDMLASQKSNFVKTDYDNGFNYSDYLKVCSILDLKKSNIVL